MAERDTSAPGREPTGPGGMPLLSVVLAIRDPVPAQLRRCLASFAALAHAADLELVVVNSGALPSLPADLTAGFAGFRVVETPPAGIYAAYNAGSAHACGRYTLFFGADDVALPGLDELIVQVLQREPAYQLVAASCYMQALGVARPSRRRHGLIYANWCHQGLFYQTAWLRTRRYDPQYQVQADHWLNLQLVGNPAHRVHVTELVVAYFSAGGRSSGTVDLPFWRDFPDLVAQAYGRGWGWLARVHQALLTLRHGPPSRRFQRTFRRRR